MQRGNFIPTQGRQSWSALYSLPANLSTAMLLIDYSTHGLTTPTPWSATVLPLLSRQARAMLALVQAILGHGAVLRLFFLARLPVTAPAQHDWEALREWLVSLSEADVEQLLNQGILENLEYYRLYLQPQAEVEQWLECLGTRRPDECMLADKERRLLAARAVLLSWGIEQYEPMLALVEEPARFLDAVRLFLEDLWLQAFRAAWEERQASLRLSAEAAQAWLDSEASAHTPDEIVFRVTGLLLTEELQAQLRQAARIAFVPCLFLGSYLSLAAVAGTCYIFYEPQRQVLPSKEMAGQERPTAFQVTDLEALGPTLAALGDATSLAILMILVEHGELFAQQVAARMHVHQSTISRHFARLERTGLVAVHRSGGLKYYNINRQRIQDVCQLLLKTFA